MVRRNPSELADLSDALNSISVRARQILEAIRQVQPPITAEQLGHALEVQRAVEAATVAFEEGARVCVDEAHTLLDRADAALTALTQPPATVH